MLRVPVSGLAPGDRVLPETASRYVVRVHRLAAGDRFVVFDVEQATEADAELVSAQKDAALCRVSSVRPASRLPRASVTLVQAIGKSDKPDQVVRDATALGASRVVLCESARVVVKSGDRGDRRRARLRTIAVEAARQCGRGDVPELHGPTPLSEVMTSIAPLASLRLLLDPGARTTLFEALAGWNRDEPLCLLVGPEGGFDAAEQRLAAGAGFVPVCLGPFVLRTETAALAALGAIAARW